MIYSTGERQAKLPRSLWSDWGIDSSSDETVYIQRELNSVHSRINCCSRDCSRCYVRLRLRRHHHCGPMVVLRRTSRLKRSEEMITASQAERRIFLDIVVRQRPAVVQLFPFEDEALLV